MARKRVAIVGSGCAGIGAAWALNTSTEHEVHIFEADESLGGHTNTVPFKHGDRKTTVDTGFIVYNTATYPNLIRFFESLDVKTAATDMTFGVSRDGGVFEWAGTSVDSIFAQRANIVSPRMWRMLYDVLRFNQYALDLLRRENDGTASPASTRTANGSAKPPKTPQRLETIGEYLDREKYSQTFRDDYLIPMTAAVWSTSPEKCSLNFPAVTLVRFMWNHHLLSSVSARPQWRTIPGGSQQYIDKALADFPPERIHLNRPVTGTEDINGKVILQFEDSEDLFDHVVLACHGDTAHTIIQDGGTQEERDVLSGFSTSTNMAYLHSDPKLLPKNRRAWSAWNLLTSSSKTGAAATDPGAVCLTYNMNILQHIPTSEYGNVLVTLNPIHKPDPETIQGSWVYSHPLYTPSAIAAQKQLARIQNTRGISYAGAWTKYGFHEDGFSSGLAVAVEHLGATLPWDFVDSTFARGRRPPLTFADRMARMAIYGFGWGVFWYEVVFWVLGLQFLFRSGSGSAKQGKA